MALTPGDLQAIGEVFDRKFDEKIESRIRPLIREEIDGAIEDKIRPVIREEIHASESLLRDDMKTAINKSKGEIVATIEKEAESIAEMFHDTWELMEPGSKMVTKLKEKAKPTHN